MGRAYIRLDPDFFERKALDQGYKPGAVAALIGTFCLAETQPRRGYFRNRAILAALLGPYRRYVKELVDRGDLIEEEDGRLYVDGWKEWQEGDVTVPERMRRLRAREKRRATGAVTPAVTPVEVTPRLAEAVRSGDIAEAGGRNGAPKDDPNDEKLIASLRHFAGSRNELIAKDARERLERMGVPVQEGG